jgi:hypothetical protein
LYLFPSVDSARKPNLLNRLLREIQEDIGLAIRIEQKLRKYLQRLTDTSVTLNYLRCRVASNVARPY